MNNLLDQLTDDLTAIFAPGDDRSVHRWCEDEVSLSLRQTEMPGPYSTLMTPYVREPLDCFKDDRISDVVLCWGTQTSKSTVIMLGVGWSIVHKPSPCVWVMPNEQLASSFSETRWLPMVEDCAPLKAKRHYNSKAVRPLHQNFTDCDVNFVGSNSPAQLASRPARLLVMDEVDKLARQRQNEASAMYLAENRTKSFTNPLRVKTSTPTTDAGDIWKEFERTDKRYYNVPCPHCHELITFEWENVKWDAEAKGDDGEWTLSRVKVTAHYECQLCKGKIHDAHKTMMLRAGKWVPTNEGAEAGRRGYHLNSLYAPWRSCSFGALAVKWLESQKDTGALQDFMNSALALPWRNTSINVNEEHVLKMRSDTYRRGIVPLEPLYIILTADPGLTTGTHWLASAVMENDEIFVIDWGTCLSIEDLLVLPLQLEYKLAGTEKMLRPMRGLTDSGSEPERVYEMCRRSNQFWWATRGLDSSYGTWSEVPIRTRPGMSMFTFVDTSLKNELYGKRIAQQSPPRIYLPSDASADLVAQLSGQRLESVSTKMRFHRWRKVVNDHWGDALKQVILGQWVFSGYKESLKALLKGKL